MSNDKKVIKLLDKDNIPYEDKYLVHTFRDISPIPILESGKILSISNQTTPITSLFYIEESVSEDYKDLIFTSFIHKKSRLTPYIDCIYLLLDISLLEKKCCSTPIYLCPRWSWGNVGEEGCLEYKGDLNDWINYIKGATHVSAPFGMPSNEVVIPCSENDEGKCVKGEISLKKYLKAIVINKEVIKDAENLKAKYPQYNWIIL